MNESPQAEVIQSAAHYGVVVPDTVNKQDLIDTLVAGRPVEGLERFCGLSGQAFSVAAMEREMELEQRFDEVRVAVDKNRKLRTFSSGERRKEFLKFCLSKAPDFLILDTIFDHLDANSREVLARSLEELSEKMLFLQLATRKSDLLPFLQELKELDHQGKLLNPEEVTAASEKSDLQLPTPDTDFPEEGVLVEFRGVSVTYGERRILKDIRWQIENGEFWQLVGPNGSGKTTLLDMITGENHKGYGQELYLFGRKKGSGESIWEIKKKIGYFSPAMVDMFRRTTSVQEMLLSGFYDSVGLYQKPSGIHQKQALQYLKLAEMEGLENSSFQQLSVGQQRVLLILRAIVKQPPLLILDEPTEGMDEQNVALVIELINMLVHQKHITTIMVSHRIEKGLLPTSVFELIPGEGGSIGRESRIL